MKAAGGEGREEKVAVRVEEEEEKKSLLMKAVD